MPEELTPESKLYVKEEIEKTRKEIREDLEKVKSKATKTFTTVALVVGLITGLGVYGSAKHYINTAVEANLGTETLAEIEKNRIQARNSYNKIAEYETKAEEILSGRIIIGTIVPYGGKVETTSEEPNEVREGWFFCNGASLDREEYEDLFKVIGVAFGEPNDSTFNLPDLRGRFVRGVDHKAGNDPDRGNRKAGNLRGNKGDKVGSVQDDAFAKHLHSLEKDVWKHWRSFEGAGGDDRALKDIKVGDGDVLWIRNTQVSGVSKETRPKNIYVNWIIKSR